MKTILKKTAAVIAIVGLFIVSQLPSIVMALWQRNQHQLELWQSIVILILQLMVLIGFYILARKRKLISSGIKYWLSWKTLGIASLGFVALFIVKIIAGIILTYEGKTTTNNQETITQMFNNSSLLLMFMFIVIIAPLTEEIIFRGLIPQLFSKRFEGLGFGLGALLFGLLHGPSDIGSFVLYVGMGTILAFICYKLKHLEYSLWTHALNNGLGFLLLLFK